MARERLSFGKAFYLKVELLQSQVIPRCPFDPCWNQDTTQQKSASVAVTEDQYTNTDQLGVNFLKACLDHTEWNDAC